MLLGALTAVGPFSIDMYLPGLPSIARDFAAPIANVQLTLTSFFFGIAFGQLLYGPIIDRFGRKIPLIVGLVIYILSTIGCALSNSVDMLIVFRLLQSLGACAGMVISRAIVRDVFSPHEGAKVFSQIILVMGVAPIVAPTVGGFLLTYTSWRIIFVVLALISAATLATVWFYLPETRQPDRGISLRLGPVFEEYLEVLKTPRFYIYTLTAGFAAAVLFSYIAGSPFVFMEIYGFSKAQYGILFGINAAGLILGSQLNNLLLNRFESVTITKFVAFLYLPVGLLLLTSLELDLGPYPVMVLLFFLVSGFGFIIPNSSALSMAPFKQNAGSASALMGALQMGFGGFASAIVSLLHDGTAVPMGIVMAASGFMAFVIPVFFRKHETVPVPAS